MPKYIFVPACEHVYISAIFVTLHRLNFSTRCTFRQKSLDITYCWKCLIIRPHLFQYRCFHCHELKLVYSQAPSNAVCLNKHFERLCRSKELTGFCEISFLLDD